MGNLVDYIEAYIKKMLVESHNGVIETQRSNLADKFKCVPSQINYVLSTRFTMEKGYLVETRRGGGGYIRIFKVTMDPRRDLSQVLNSSIGNCISYNSGIGVIQRFVEEGWLTVREGKMLAATIHPGVLHISGDRADLLRAIILKSALLKVFS